MKVTNDPPPVTPEQREALLRAVRAGRLPWAPTLMKRAGITREECFPDGKQPLVRGINQNYDAELGHVIDPRSPGDRYTAMVIQLAIMHGYELEDVTERVTNSEKFKQQLKNAEETVKNGGTVTIGMEDLKFLVEDE